MPGVGKLPVLGAMLLACACSTPSTGDSSLPDAVHHTLSPVLTAEGHIDSLNVEIRFRGDADGSTLIRFPSGYAGRTDLLRHYADISVVGGHLVAGEQPGVWTVEASPEALLTLTYNLRSGIDREPTSSDEQPFAPWIRNDWFFIYGPPTWARLQRPPETPATFTWTGPADITLATDLDHFTVGGGQLGDVTQSTLLGGRDVRILQKGPVRAALRGTFANEDDDLLEMASAVIEHQRLIFGAPLDAPYLVNIAAVEPDTGVRGAIGGTGQGYDAFSIVMTPDLPWSRLVSVFAHETFHSWPLGEVEADEIWLHEGFTDYYGIITPLRAGVMTLDDFADVWNGNLRAYATSPARARSNADIVAARWQDPDAERMHYLRGALVATLWDRRLRNASQGRVSMDDATLERYQRRNSAPDAGALDILTQVAAANGVDIGPDIEHYITRGEPVTLPPDAFGPCFRVENAVVPAFERGFDAEASARTGMIATGVDPDGPAYAAGLRDGMGLKRFVSGDYGDSTVEQVWAVERADGEELLLRWTPAGAATIEIQRLVRVSVETNLASCALD